MKSIEDMVADGLSNSDIAKELGVHRTTVGKYIKRLGLVRTVTNDSCVICGKPVSGRNRCDTCNTKLRRYRAKKAAVEYLGGKCSHCGWSGNLAAFDFHHTDPSIKEFNPSAVNLANRKWSDVKVELDKCILLCAICHRIVHNDYGEQLQSIRDNSTIFKSE